MKSFMMKNLLNTAIAIFLLSATLSAQFGIGAVVTNDLYQHYLNPSDNISDPSHGNALLNLGLGPKIWVGAKNFSVAVDARANIGLTGFTLGENKGLGAVAIPVLATLNFNGLSSMDRAGNTGFSIGGGIQYVKTELYGLDQEFVDLGTTRDFFQVYVVQLGFGYGVSGASGQGIIRYGFNPDNDSRSINIGLQYDFNLIMMKKIDDPNSAL